MAEPSVEVAEAAGVGIDGIDRPTEDRVIRLSNAVILADGATSLRNGERSGGWYAESLCAALAERLTATPDGDLRLLLAAAIAALAREHRLVPGFAPCSTVAMLRWSADLVDALVLADSPIVVFTDVDAYLLVGERDVDGGFRVAEADPAAAAHARTASWPRARVTEALLASNGVSCGVDDYHIFDWQGVLEQALRTGTPAVLTVVRVAEVADPDGTRWPRPKRHDDKTLVLVRF
jgi:hypothetical protein